MTREGERQKKLKAAGLCCMCGKFSRINKSHCAACRIRHNVRTRASQRERVERHLAAGQCRLCDDQLVTKAHCARHRDYMREYQKAYMPKYMRGYRKKKRRQQSAEDVGSF